MSWRNKKDKENERNSNTPFDLFEHGFFGEFYKRMMENIEEFMNTSSEEENPNFITKRYGPYYYGRITTIGPDGNPQTREYGNFNPYEDNISGINTPISKQIPETTKPEDSLIDAFIEETVVRILMELPGVNKEFIDVKATPQKVTISAKSNYKDYFGEKELNVRIKPKTAKATFNNGILEIIFEKEQPAKSDDEFEVSIN